MTHVCITYPCPVCHPVRHYVMPPQPTYGVPYQPQGCICPPTSEQTCEGLTCPRKGLRPPNGIGPNT